MYAHSYVHIYINICIYIYVYIYCSVLQCVAVCLHPRSFLSGIYIHIYKAYNSLYPHTSPVYVPLYALGCGEGGRCGVGNEDDSMRIDNI